MTIAPEIEIASPAPATYNGLPPGALDRTSLFTLGTDQQLKVVLTLAGFNKLKVRAFRDWFDNLNPGDRVFQLIAPQESAGYLGILTITGEYRQVHDTLGSWGEAGLIHYEISAGYLFGDW